MLVTVGDETSCFFSSAFSCMAFAKSLFSGFLSFHLLILTAILPGFSKAQTDLKIMYACFIGSCKFFLLTKNHNANRIKREQKPRAWSYHQPKQA